MKLGKMLLYIYFSFCVITLFANFTSNEYLFMICKTAIFPVILFYYFDQTESINYKFLVSILFFYFVDLITILKVNNEIAYLIFSSLVSYSILLGFAISDNHKIEFKPKIVGSSIFVFICLVTTLSLVLSGVNENRISLLFLMFFLGLLISILTAFVIYNYLNSISKSNFFFLVCCICFIFGSGFYVIHKMIYYNLLIDCFTTIMKLISYFFLVKYIIFREIENKATKY